MGAISIRALVDIGVPWERKNVPLHLLISPSGSHFSETVQPHLHLPLLRQRSRIAEYGNLRGTDDTIIEIVRQNPRFS